MKDTNKITKQYTGGESLKYTANEIFLESKDDDFVTVKKVEYDTNTEIKGLPPPPEGGKLPMLPNTYKDIGDKTQDLLDLIFAKNLEEDVAKEMDKKMNEDKPTTDVFEVSPATEQNLDELTKDYIEKVKQANLHDDSEVLELKKNFPYNSLSTEKQEGNVDFSNFCTDLVDSISTKVKSTEIEKILDIIVGDIASKIVMSAIVPNVVDVLKAQQDIITELTEDLKQSKNETPKPSERPQVLFEDSPTILKMKKDIEDVIVLESTITSSVEKLLTKDDVLEERIKVLEEHPRTSKVEIEIKQGKTATKKELDDTLPIIFEELVSLAINRINIMLVGPMGCGKSTTAMLLAKVLELPFGFLCASEGMSESMLEGWLLPTGEGGTIEYTPSTFITFYEKGGVFLLDEFDAANANTLTVINSAIAGNTMALPKRKDNPIVKKHPDFILIAAANTFGMGADRVYTARNQLDGATLDRFKLGTIIMDYDEGIEAKIVNSKILKWGKHWRNKVRKAKLRREVSTRFLKDLSIMYETCPAIYGKVDKWEEVLFQGWTEDEKRKIQGA